MLVLDPGKTGLLLYPKSGSWNSVSSDSVAVTSSRGSCWRAREPDNWNFVDDCSYDS